MSKDNFKWELDFKEDEKKEYENSWNHHKAEKYIGLVVSPDEQLEGVYKDSEFIFAVAKNQISKSKNGEWLFINKGEFKEQPIFIKHYLAVDAYNGNSEIVIFKSRDERSMDVFQNLKKWMDENPDQLIKIKKK